MNTWIPVTWIRSWRILCEVACAFPMRFTQVLSWSKASPATADKATTSFLDTPGVSRWRLAFSGYVWISSWSLNLNCNSLHPVLFVVFRTVGKTPLLSSPLGCAPPPLWDEAWRFFPPSHICRLYKDVEFQGQDRRKQSIFGYISFIERTEIRHRNKLARESIPKGERQEKHPWHSKDELRLQTNQQDLKIWRSVYRSRCSWFEVSQWPKPLHTRCRLLPCKLSELRHANKRAPTKWASWTDELPFNFEPQNSFRCWFVWETSLVASTHHPIGVLESPNVWYCFSAHGLPIFSCQQKFSLKDFVGFKPTRRTQVDINLGSDSGLFSSLKSQVLSISVCCDKQCTLPKTAYSKNPCILASTRVNNGKVSSWILTLHKRLQNHCNSFIFTSTGHTAWRKIWSQRVFENWWR